MFGLWRTWRRRGLRDKPVPPHWEAILQARVPFYRHLEGELRARFVDDLKIFVWEKVFVGAKGLLVTDEMRVVIAAAAVRLTLHLDLSLYDRLTEIVVYPHDYTHDGKGHILGEAHTWGTVVLSWPSVLQGLANARDGHDTATHEFAHVLDIESGGFDGTPRLRASEDYRAWARVFTHHFENLREHRGAERKALRAYGATNEAEFFAVATEAFFEKPRQLARQTPQLYDQLQRLYGFDPAADERDGVPSGRDLGARDSCPCGSARPYRKCCRPR